MVAQALLADFRDNLKIRGLNRVRVLIRYDLEGITDSEYEASRTTIFAEPPVDLVYDETFPTRMMIGFLRSNIFPDNMIRGPILRLSVFS